MLRFQVLEQFIIFVNFKMKIIYQLMKSLSDGETLVPKYYCTFCLVFC